MKLDVCLTTFLTISHDCVCVCVLVNCLAMDAPHTGTALDIVDLAAEIDRSKFVKNVKGRAVAIRCLLSLVLREE